MNVDTRFANVTVRIRRATPTDVGSRRLPGRSAALLAATLLATSACAPDPPAAVVGIVVDSCDPGQEVGSGMVVGPGLVLTSAHVLAGARDIEVEQDGTHYPGTIVGFDPEMDLAYVTFSGPHVDAVEIGDGIVDVGEAGVAYVVRHGQVEALPVTVTRRVEIRTEDIYIEGETLRAGWDLLAEIEPGDSGGAVVVDGEIVGVLWAKVRSEEPRAYAIDPKRSGGLIRRQLATGDLGDDVDIERCH